MVVSAKLEPMGVFDRWVYVLKWPNSSDSGGDYLASHTIDLGSRRADGVWKLRVTDVYLSDVGYISPGA